MKVQFIGETKPLMLTKDKVYNVLSFDKEHGWLEVIDESGENYAYPPECFEIIEGSIEDFNNK